MKNVAGYDLPRLLTGSFGSLGVIVSATFKLYPLTADVGHARRRSVEPGGSRDADGQTVVEPSDADRARVCDASARLIVRFESIEASVQQQSETAARLIIGSGFTARTLSGPEEDRFWSDHATFAEDDRRALLKVSVLPTELAPTLTLIERLAGRRGYAAAGRAGAGVFQLCITEDVQVQKRVIDGLRDALPLGRGSAVVVKSPPELRTHVDMWGPMGDGLALMKSVKQQFDPAGVLSPGRGPGGL